MFIGCILFAILLGFLYLLNSKSADIYLSFIKCLIVLAFTTLLFTEISSIFNALNHTNAVIFWLFFGLIVGFMIYLKEPKNNNIHVWLNYSFLKQGSLFDNLIFVFLITSISYLFILCILVPPNNLDSHNYHLNRIVNWIQNENVNHFPTIFAPELYHNAMAEYLVLQTYLLSDTDRFVALVQFTAMIGNLFTTSLIAKEVGLRRKAQLFSIFVTFTMTIGLLESTTTQVDYVACFFFTFFVLYYLKWNSTKSNKDIVWMSMAFALGAFTKYTIFLYAFPFYAFLVLKLLFNKKGKAIFQISFAVIVSIALVYTLFWYRNYELFDNILSPTKGSRLYSERIPNEEFGIRSFISVLARNILIHAGLPIEAFNSQIDKMVLGLHSILNINIQDTRYSFNLYSTRFSIQEDMAPNTFHFYGGILALGYISLKKRGHKLLNQITLMAFLGVVLCSFMLKFELWVSRTQMPFFSILSVYIAYFISIIDQRMAKILIVIQACFALLVITTNPNKPLINLKYQIKKFQSYIPAELSLDRTKAAQFDSTEITGWYYKTDEVYFLKPDEVNKKAIFNALEKSHYYDVEKDFNILNKSRSELYFAPNYYEFTDVENLFKEDLNEINNIGILFYEGQGYYRYWAYLNYEKGVKAQMQSILFSKELLDLPNSNNSYEYDYVLTDHLEYLKNFIPDAGIEREIKSGKFYLVKLKKPQTDHYSY